MLKKQSKNQRAESGVVLHINLLGAIVFSLALVIAAAMVTYAVARPSHPPLYVEAVWFPLSTASRFYQQEVGEVGQEKLC